MLKPDMGETACDLAIFDNDQYFSFCKSPFRRTEYAFYLQSFPRAAIYSTYAEQLAAEGKPRSEVHAEYQELEPQVFPLAQAGRLPAPRLAYTVFLSNVSYFLPYFERHGIPFCFTLYPGGGFLLDDVSSDLRLSRVLSSPWFRKVIVTQEVTRRYLLDRRFCRPDQVELIWGCVLPLEELNRARVPRRYYPEDKPTLDMAFVAFKYSPRGEDKGFDVFADCSSRLAQVMPQARFHVVGNFTAADLPAHAPQHLFTFHGPRPTDFFPQFYSGMDLILAPTRPFILGPGAFDGFPTAASTEAAACGVPVFCTDPLGMNPCFVPDQDIVIIPADAEAACAAIRHWCHEPQRLRQLGANGQRVVQQRYSRAAQLTPRLAVLQACAGAELQQADAVKPWLDAVNVHLWSLEHHLREACRERDYLRSRSWKSAFGRLRSVLRSIRDRCYRVGDALRSWKSAFGPLRPLVRSLRQRSRQ